MTAFTSSMTVPAWLATAADGLPAPVDGCALWGLARGGSRQLRVAGHPWDAIVGGELPDDCDAVGLVCAAEHGRAVWLATRDGLRAADVPAGVEAGDWMDPVTAAGLDRFCGRRVAGTGRPATVVLAHLWVEAILRTTLDPLWSVVHGSTPHLEVVARAVDPVRTVFCDRLGGDGFDLDDGDIDELAVTIARSVSWPGLWRLACDAVIDVGVDAEVAAWMGPELFSVAAGEELCDLDEGFDMVAGVAGVSGVAWLSDQLRARRWRV